MCALQRANNVLGKTREVLDCASFKEIFKENAALRDLKLLRETLTMDEIAAVLSARANMAVKKRGVQIGDLDFSGLLEAAKLGNLAAGGAGDGSGKGKGGGRGGGRGKHKKKKKKKKGGKDSDDDDSGGGGGSDSSGGGSSRSSASEEEEDAEDAVADFIGGKAGAAAGKLFENAGEAKDDENEDDEEEEPEAEEEGSEEWLMKDHPIFGKWMKALADGKAKGELAAEIAKEQWNPALLDVPPTAVVPDIPAATVPLKDWLFMDKFIKMSKVGLPRPMVEHKMIQDSVNPALLDADPAATVSAILITPPKKKKGPKGPTIVRKKLHWVPIKGKIEATIWAGPPGDLIAAAAQLITDEKEFEKLFIQKPEDLKKKKGKKDDGGVIILVDHKRAMNAGIALAKLKVSAAPQGKGTVCAASPAPFTPLFHLMLATTDHTLTLILNLIHRLHPSCLNAL